MELFSQLEGQYGLPSGLLDSVWNAESGRGRAMLSPKGAQGHFQFMPATAKQYGLQNPGDLTQSATAAARMLSDLLGQAGGDLNKALAGYNWGIGNVQRKGMDAAPAETRNYIAKVMGNMQPQDKPSDEWAPLAQKFAPASAQAKPEAQDEWAQLASQFAQPQAQPKAAPTQQQQGQSMAATQPAPPARDKFDIRGEGWDRIQNYSGKNAIGGAVRGAGSIGATLLTPVDAAARTLNNGQAVNVGGIDIAGQDRRAGMDAALDTAGVDRNSSAFKTNKLGAEIAGTSGVGGLLAKGLAAVPGLATAFPGLVNAVQTGGMSANGVQGLPGVITRAAGGAINGAATAGLVNPEDAKTGALIGGATPLIAQGAGVVGSMLGRTPKPGVNPTTLETARAGMDAGYVVPPNMLKPSFTNQVVESISGKQATQQIASMRNSDVTEGLVRKALGIADDVPLTQSTMENLRKTAGKAYSEVSQLSPQAAADLEALKIARNESQAWFKAYNRSASPVDLAKAKELRQVAEQLETALEAHAKSAGAPELIPALRDARKAIAKTYTVGRALNDATGTVDARVLGRMSEKGLPLSDGLEVAGKFASAFPTITKSPMQVGSPAAHNLKSIASMAMGGSGLAALGPMGAAAAAVPFVAPPVARSIMFSNAAQRGLLSQPSGPGLLRGLLSSTNDDLAPLLYRSNGLLAAGG